MASRSLNRVILIGNLTRDPELKYTPAGTAVCTFGIATNRSWTTADAWQKLAELCGKLLTKGRKVFVEGRLIYRSFTGKDGQQRSITEIVLDDFIVFGDGKRPAENGEEVKEATPKEKAGKTGQEGETSAPEEAEENVNPDDIPF